MCTWTAKLLAKLHYATRHIWLMWFGGQITDRLWHSDINVNPVQVLAMARFASDHVLCMRVRGPSYHKADGILAICTHSGLHEKRCVASSKALWSNCTGSNQPLCSHYGSVKSNISIGGVLCGQSSLGVDAIGRHFVPLKGS